MKDNGTDIAEIKNQVDEILENIRRINSRVENVISLVDELTNTKNLNEGIEKMLEKITHSITQELIDEGAFDVAKAYIDFLKARANRPLTVDKLTVSPIGKKTMKKNNGADFGPDTKGTKTSGIQEAIDKAAEKDKKEVPKDDDTGN
ncbi:MAG: hypothetical protein M1285_02860 [Candidatus Thermoplasmatota archaeon]|nr:hypothetical protein [Candidatus Thermoplasmatota archaeon]